MIKKCFLVLSFLFLLSISTSSSCESINAFLSGNDRAGQLYDATPLENEIAVLSSSGVWLYYPDTKELVPLLKYVDILNDSLFDDSGYPDYIFAVDKTIYLFNSQSCAFYKMTSHELIPCLEKAKEIGVYEDQGELLQKQFVNGVSTNDGFFLLYKSMTFENGWMWELYHLDPTKETITAFGNQPIDVLYSCSNDKLLAGKKTDDDNGQMLYLFDREAGAFYSLDGNVYNSDAVGFVQDNELLVFLEDRGKATIADSNGDQTVFSFIPCEHLFSFARAFIWNNTYVYLQDSVLNIREIDTSPKEQITLKILGSVSGDIVRKYMSENPEINIVFDAREDDFLGLQEALISRDSSVDLFLVESDGAYDDIVNKGYAACLTDSEHLMKQVSEFYSWGKDLLIRDNELYAIPVSINSEYWTINRSMWNKLEFGDYPRSYADIYRAMKLWDDCYADEYYNYSLFECTDELSGMIRNIIQQYLLIHEDWTSPVTFNTEEFRIALQNLMNNSDMFGYEGDTLPLIMDYAQYLGTGYNDMDIVESFVPPALTQDSKQAVRAVMEVLMLNTASKHKSEAINFLEYYLDHLDMMTKYQIDASCVEPLRYDNYEENVHDLTMQVESLCNILEQSDDPEERNVLFEKIQTLQNRLENVESKWFISPEDIEIYHRIAKTIIIPTHTIYPENGEDMNVFDSLIIKFLDGRLSQEQFIASLDEKSMIIFAEEQ